MSRGMQGHAKQLFAALDATLDAAWCYHKVATCHVCLSEVRGEGSLSLKEAEHVKEKALSHSSSLGAPLSLP